MLPVPVDDERNIQVPVEDAAYLPIRQRPETSFQPIYVNNSWIWIYISQDWHGQYLRLTKVSTLLYMKQ